MSLKHITLGNFCIASDVDKQNCNCPILVLNKAYYYYYYY